MRTPVIAGNWKMNKTPEEAAALIKELAPLVKGAGAVVVVCVPAADLVTAKAALKGSGIKLGAQNVHFKDSGAFTGEISAPMLKACGVEYVIIGHSERRQYFGETDETVNLRVKAAVAGGLIPIICVGERKEQREAGYTNALVQYQTLIALTGLTADEVAKVVMAYEPVWAIGTGLTATDEQANETIGVIRAAIASAYGKRVAEKVRIQYGGSMNPKNAAGLMAQPQIDGGLIGGASLKAEDFSKVVHYNKTATA
jgi:triosephosphate isomerase (TIM)